MSKRFPVHAIESAPEAARPTLESVEKRLGMLPNLFGVLATAPVAGAAYESTMTLLSQKGRLSPAEPHAWEG